MQGGFSTMRKRWLFFIQQGSWTMSTSFCIGSWNPALTTVIRQLPGRPKTSIPGQSVTWSQEQGMRREVARVLDVEEDSVRYYHLCNRCKERILTNGVKVPVQEEKDFEII